LQRRRKGDPGKVRLAQRGRYAGDQLSVDHIIPVVVVPELDKVIANLTLLPLRADKKKKAKIGQQQRNLARQLNAAGLLSDAGLKAVLEHR
jgi:hypothetical protein